MDRFVFLIISILCVLIVNLDIFILFESVFLYDSLKYEFKFCILLKLYVFVEYLMCNILRIYN